MKKLLKQYKVKQFTNIYQNYKYIYIFRYYDFNFSELIQIKKQLQKLKYNFCFLKKKTITNNISNLEGQGSILILYSNKEEFD
jgi:ribosomal protein L10